MHTPQAYLLSQPLRAGLNDLDQDIAVLRAAIATLRVPATPGEYDIHARVGAALAESGLDYQHEAVIAPRCRVDFLVGRVGIEVKKGKPPRAQLLKQVMRYLESARLDALVVVVQRSASLPAVVRGKRCEVLCLNRLWGVAL